MSESTGDTDAESETDADAPPDRDAVLKMLGDVVQEAHRKAANGRVRDPENERVRQGWIRATAYAAGQFRQLKRDEELAALDERLARLESEWGIESGDGGDVDALLAAADDVDVGSES